MDLVEKIADESNSYAQQFRNSRGNIFSEQSRVNYWQSVIAEEGIFHAYKDRREAECQTVLLMNQLVPMSIFAVISLDRF